MTCKICGNQTEYIFSSKILCKYPIIYFRCSVCKFIQTEEPYWISEAYSSAITPLDIGYVMRNEILADQTGFILKNYFKKDSRFIDFGAGYGLFVRVMRDRGFDFYWQDKYTENLFAKHFEATELEQYEVLTAFEVFEHLENPMQEIEKMFSLSKSIIFSTELIPNQAFENAESWWYFSPEIGQHIAFYSKESLEFIAKKYNCYLYTDNKWLHLLTPTKFKTNPIQFSDYFRKFKRKAGKLGRQASLLANDHKSIKSKLYPTERE